MFGQWKKEFLKQLNLAKNNFNPDVILTHHLWILSSMAREVFPDKKVVAVCHNTDIRQARQNESLKKKHIHSLKDVDNVLALSNRQFKDIEEVFGISEEKIIDIGAGYNEKIFYPPEHYPEKEKVELAYAGKFDDSKGFYELIKAFRKIEENDDSVTIDLIGNITEQNKERIKKEVGNSKNINVYNAVSQKELADIMRTKDIFILPSYFEGLGLIAVEALGSGLRVVATKIDGLIELLGKELNVDEIIEYVDMPTIYDTDKAVEEEKPAFVLRLADKIENMIKRTREKREIDKALIEKIQKKSWKSKIEDIKDVLCKDNNSCRQTNMKKDMDK
jgi:glycosyltransferase, group 1 family